jgi:hypothetical protein
MSLAMARLQHERRLDGYCHRHVVGSTENCASAPTLCSRQISLRSLYSAIANASGHGVQPSVQLIPIASPHPYAVATNFKSVTAVQKHCGDSKK